MIIGSRRLFSFLATGALLLTVAACNNAAVNGGSIWMSSTPQANWAIIGGAGFTVTNVAYTSMAIDPTSGTPYIAFSDGAVGARTTVMKYAGGGWTNMGTPGFSANQAQNVNLAFDSNGVPYVSYLDAISNKANVMVYTGIGASGWQSLGLPDFSPLISEVTFAINKSNTPFVAFVRSLTNKVSVMTYTGAWVFAGPPNFTAPGASNVSLAFDSQGFPWVAFADGSAGNNATVMSFNGSVWSLVGPVVGSASTGAVAWTSLAIDSRSTPPTPYLAVMDTGYAGLTTVKRYQAGTGTWMNVGNPGFSAGQPFSGSLVLSAGGIPYVAYQDGPPGGTGRATVMAYSGTAWSPAGTPGFSPGPVQSTSLALDPLGVPYIAFMDGNSGNKATVMAYK
jgi:hypothetical protein